MDNLELYDKVRGIPNEAKKKITGGRLNGKTDINPMWRIKTLTEQFGPCGIGWKYEITGQRLEEGSDKAIAAFVDINLYVKVEGEWSAAIPGIGGNMFVEKERNGLYTSDECFKMALTDALSVACKALGFGADVYWEADATKYDQRAPKQEQRPKAPPAPPSDISGISQAQRKRLFALIQQAGMNEDSFRALMMTMTKKESTKDLTPAEYDRLCAYLEGDKIA